MGRVHLDLPFCCGALHLRVLETKGNDLLNKHIDQRLSLLFEHLPRYGGDTINNGAAILVPGSRLLQHAEDLPDEFFKLLLFLLLEDNPQGEVDLPQGRAMNV